MTHDKKSKETVDIFGYAVNLGDEVITNPSIVSEPFYIGVVTKICKKTVRVEITQKGKEKAENPHGKLIFYKKPDTQIIVLTETMKWLL